MITGTIVFLFIVAIAGAAGDGDMTTIWVCVGVILLVLAIGSAGRNGDKAFSNFVDYWAEGGPDKKR